MTSVSCLVSPFQLIILFLKWACYILYFINLCWGTILGPFKCRPVSIIILPCGVLMVFFLLRLFKSLLLGDLEASVEPRLNQGHIKKIKIDARNGTRILSPLPSFCWSDHSWWLSIWMTEIDALIYVFFFFSFFLVDGRDFWTGGGGECCG